jgi:EmrB/QacA subfamily drug resistance transporter
VKTNRPLTVVSIMLLYFMAELETTVVSTAMPTVIGELGGLALYSWVFTAYLLSSTVTTMIYGKLADLFGRKPVLYFGIALFLAGTMASGQARTMAMLIAFRALQGLGAGAIRPVATTISGDIYTTEERAQMMGIFASAGAVAGIVGPLVGGFIVKHWSWRWVFYCNVPVGLGAFAMLGFSLHEQVEKRAHKLDYAGASLFAVATVALLAGAYGGQSTWALPLAALLFVAFALVEKRAPEPLVPLALFRVRTIAVCTATSALVGAAMLATVTYVPLFVQGVVGLAPTQAGSAFAPMIIALPVASAFGGRVLVPRIGYRALIRIGTTLSATVALALALALGPSSSLNFLRAMTCLLGIGNGFALPSLLVAVQGSVEWKQRGVATASILFFRTMGSTVAVGVMGGLLAAALSRDPTIPAGAASDLLVSRGKHLLPEVAKKIAAAMGSGLASDFWVIAALFGAAFVTSMLLPSVPLAARAAKPAPATARP